MWRDKGWYERRGGVTVHHNPNCRCSACVDYETGADAMLKAICTAIKEEREKEALGSLLSIGYGSVLKFLDGEGFE